MDRRAKYFLFISLGAFTAFLVVAFVTVSPQDWPFGGQSVRDVRNLSGPFGSLLAFICFRLLGDVFAWFVPVACLALSAGFAADRAGAAGRAVAKAAAMVVLLSAFFALVPATRGSTLLTGSLGSKIASVVSVVVGDIGGTILLITLFLLLLRTEVRRLGYAGLGAARGAAGLTAFFARARLAAGGYVRRLVDARRTNRLEKQARIAAAEHDRLRAEIPPRPEQGAAEAAHWLEEDFERLPAAPRPAAEPERRPARAARPRPPRPVRSGIPIEHCELPPISILGSSRQGGASYTSDKLRAWSEVLETKLSNYGVQGRVTAVNQGPLVTTFEFEPAPGVKIKDIVSRSDDLALAMRARSLRLIAPIPGRAVVGIEIPNPDQDVVLLRHVLEEIPERLRLSGVMIALGVDAIGKPFNMNLCAAPHLLMAGTTGSGKSVALNVFLASILLQYRPADVRLLLIDPKMVEMSLYNGIPHLLHPVITDPREAVRVFNYLIAEMERRNHILRKHGVKNIESYNSKVAMSGDVESGETPESLPYIVLVVDEMGDLVLTKGADLESLLSRLSNMARAVGIHMVVATQRPSVDVIVGKTKANFPTRIAFRVASKVDSRTILDCVGAEKLLGRGDMLYVDAKHPEPLRLHGAWVAEDELERLVDHWTQYEFEESHLNLVETTTGPVASGDKDAYYEDAKEIILRYRQGSTSLLQRKLHVGYARAARLLDQLELAGVVGPPEGSKPREVLIGEQEEVAPMDE